jgi:hypothetical protein
MFIPHQPLPTIAVRYFLCFSAPCTAGAAKAAPAAAEVAKKFRRVKLMGILLVC